MRSAETVSAVDSLRASYRRHRTRNFLILTGSTLVLCGAILWSLAVGTQSLSIEQLIGAFTEEGNARIVLFNVRLPRVVAALLVGIGLAIAGAVMQAVLRNPMASASTIGVSQGAAFGAAIGIIYFGGGAVVSNTASAVNVSNPLMTALLAFAGAMVSTVVVIALSRVRRAGPETIILAGVALSALFGGGIALLQYFASDVQVAAIVFWQFGDLGRVTWPQMPYLAIATAIGAIYFAANIWNYNALDAGDAAARSLGISVPRLRTVTMAVASAVAAVLVSLVGIVAFVGLIAPHIVRRLVGNDYRYVLPGSAVLGALVLLLGDTFSRTIISPVILPVGAVTSFLGAPLFLYIIFQRMARR